MRVNRRITGLLALLTLGAFAPTAHAQRIGYQLNRYEDTPVGDPFLSIEHPWYSSTRYFAAGLTLDYAHDLLVAGHLDASGKAVQDSPIITHQLQGHVDLAGSLFDRLALTASLPVVLLERGNTSPVSDVSANTGAVVGDPRIGVRVRVFGQPEASVASLSLGAYVWIPVGSAAQHEGDTTVRLMPRAMLGGVIAKHLRYSLNASFLYRATAQISAQASGAGNTLGSEVQLGAGIGATFLDQTLSFGPEALASFTVNSGLPSAQNVSDFELLGSVSYLVANTVMLQVAGGGGLVGTPGPPDGRAIFRVAYAPRRAPEAPPAVAPSDRDHDGVLDQDDLCPDEHMGKHPDPKKRGCPKRDRDHDGVFDDEDLCPDEPKGSHPDPKMLGCPRRDRDGDGVYDDEDLCPDEPKGEHPDAKRLGCPAKDTDKDGVYDYEDECPLVPMGMNPDPKRKGCPLGDRDGDHIPDVVDACPDVPGAPSPDPKKNGCPGLVEIKQNAIVILQEVYFDTDKARIQSRSFALLDSVAYVFKSQPNIKKVAVEGHTDDRGKMDHNMDLSQRRAQSVMKYLVEHGVEAGRLEAHGYGPTRPIDTNKTPKGRAKNRRVAFQILDPATPKQ